MSNLLQDLKNINEEIAYNEWRKKSAEAELSKLYVEMDRLLKEIGNKTESE